MYKIAVLNQLSPWVCVTFLVLMLNQCYSPAEGCLDIQATNFDASADKNCCCEYPNLKLEVLQRFDSLIWFADSAYTNNLGQAFKLKSAVFYLSDFSLEQNGQAVQVSDSLSFKVLSGTDTLKPYFANDFQIVRRTPVSYTLGAFPKTGQFDAFSFRIGLSDEARKILPSSAPSGHPLAAQAENMWMGADTNYVNLRLVVQRDINNSAGLYTIYLTRFDFDNLLIKDTHTFIHEIGYDFTIQLKVDYFELFRNVNWQIGDINSWKSSITSNLSKAFVVQP